MGIVIETSSLTKQYGKKQVVKDLDLKVPGGSIYGFLGPNGAGKSTTMKMILGLAKPTSGTVTVLGKTVNSRNRLSILKDTGSLIESPSYYGYENTLMVHIRHLREKIEEDPSHPVWIQTARGLGYRLKKEEGQR